MGAEFNSRTASPESAVKQESIVEILWRRKQLVLIVFGLCVMSSAVVLKVTPTRKTASAPVYVTRNLPKNADPTAVDLPTFLNTQADLIRSATVLSIAMGGPGMEAMDMFAGTDNPVAVLKERLEVSPKPQSEIVDIRLASTNPDQARDIVDAVAQAYVSHIKSQVRNVAQQDTYAQISKDRKVLDDQRDDAKTLLAALQAETASYLTPGDDVGRVAIEKLRQLSAALTTAQLDTVRLKSELDDALKIVGMDKQVNQAKLDSATVVSIESMPVLKQNLVGLNQQLIEAKRQYVPSHPAVRNMQRQIKDVQLSLAALLQQAYASAGTREKQARELYATQEKITQTINAKAAELAMLTDRAKVLDAQVSALDTKLGQLNVTESIGIEAKQLDAYVDPNSAVPDAKKTLGLAALIGLALGMLVALVREWISPSLGAVHRIADTVGVPLLGTLPRVAGHTPAELALLSYDAADTTAAEAFRSVRTSLLFGADQCQTIAVTSPSAGDGKTTLACNLAILLAQSGKRVALVDADFRQPSLATLFNLEDSLGLSGALGGEDLDPALHRTQIEHLDVLTTGPATAEVSQQLNSPRFNEILRDLRSRYDHILFDTTGVVGSNDARVIASACDTTLLVMRDERTTRFAATTARDALLSVGAMLMGIVLNDAAKTGPAYPAATERRGPAASAFTPAPAAAACVADLVPFVLSGFTATGTWARPPPARGVRWPDTSGIAGRRLPGGVTQSLPDRADSVGVPAAAASRSAERERLACRSLCSPNRPCRRSPAHARPPRHDGLHEMYFPKHLAGVIRRERARADRQQSRFCLVLFRLVPAGGRLAMLRLSRLVMNAVRTTDEVGLYDRHTVCAVLPDTLPDGAMNLIRRTREACYERGMTVEPVLYSYPTQWFDDDNAGDGPRPLPEPAAAEPPPADTLRLAPASSTVLNQSPLPMETLLCRRPGKIKRAIDVIVAGTALAGLSPVMLLAAAAIKFGDGGPVFFCQTRTGLGGRPFKIFKFRTMCANADRMKAALRAQSEQDGPAFKMTRDPRITRVGHFLRTTSLDELPQLINVLRGDMSLVGPRPLPVDEQAACDPWHRARLDVMPGLTCVWQIKGRSRVSFDDWMRMDLSYTQRYQVLHDLKLILMTIPAVLLRRGAK